jgi:hypothetical protein
LQRLHVALAGERGAAHGVDVDDLAVADGGRTWALPYTVGTASPAAVPELPVDRAVVPDAAALWTA